MTGNENDARARLAGHRGGLVLYDGICVLCSRWFRFVARRDRDRVFLFTAIQSEYGRAWALQLGIDPDDPPTNAVLIDGAVHVQSDSALAILSRLPGWRWTRVLHLVPRVLRDALYRTIARNRYAWFGRRTSCDLGGAEFADRVIS